MARHVIMPCTFTAPFKQEDFRMYSILFVQKLVVHYDVTVVLDRHKVCISFCNIIQIMYLTCVLDHTLNYFKNYL